MLNYWKGRTSSKLNFISYKWLRHLHYKVEVQLVINDHVNDFPSHEDFLYILVNIDWDR